MRRTIDRCHPPARSRRRGSLTAEFLLLMPLLLVVLLALIQFGLWLHASQRIATAGREGARVAALGGSIEDVDRAVRMTLGFGRLGQASVSASLTDPLGSPLDPGQPVEVGVTISAAEVVPDFLGPLGISLRGRTIEARVVMRRE